MKWTVRVCSYFSPRRASAALIIVTFLLLPVISIAPVADGQTSVLEKGRDYTIYKESSGRRAVFSPEPVRVWGGESQGWVDNVVVNSWGSSGEILVKSARIAVNYTRGGIKILDPNSTSTRVGNERWIALRYTAGNWLPVLIQNTAAYVSGGINLNDSGVYIYAVYENNYAKLNVTYSLKNGQALKHTVKLTPKLQGNFRILQVLTGLTGLDYVTNEAVKGTVSNTNKTISIIEGKSILFTAYQNFWLRIDQADEPKYLYAVVGKIGDLFAAVFVFGEFNNLLIGQTVTVDPTTTTYSGTGNSRGIGARNTDDVANTCNNGLAVANINTYEDPSAYRVGPRCTRPSQDIYNKYRTLLTFDTSGIPDAASVTAATLRVTYSSNSVVGTVDANFAVTVRRGTQPCYGTYGANSGNFTSCGTTLEGTIFSRTDATATAYTLTVATAGVSLTGNTQYALRADCENSVALSAAACGVDALNDEHYVVVTTPELDVTYNTAPTIGEFTASVRWDPNSASNLVFRFNDPDGQNDITTCRITGTVNSAGAFDFTYTRSTDGISWTTQPTGLTAGSASKTSVNSTSYSVTVPLTFAGTYAQIGTATATTTNTSCTDGTATGTLASNTNVGTLYGRLRFTINDSSGTALAPSSTVYLRYNNGTARTASSNSVTLTGQTDTTQEYSTQWQNSTATNGIVQGQSTLTVTQAYQNTTITTNVYSSLTLSFRRNDNSTAITPTNMTFTAPNNSTSKTITVFTGLRLSNGTITTGTIYWGNSNVRGNTSSFSFTAASQTRTFNLRVYSITPTFNRSGGSALATAVTSWTITSVNGTTSTALTGASLVTNGTARLRTVTWRGINVTSLSNTFTPSSTNPSLNLRVYSDSANNMQAGVANGNLTTPTFSSHTLQTTASATGSRQLVVQIIASDYQKAPKVFKVGGIQVTNFTYSNPTVTWTGTYSDKVFSVEWDSPTQAAGGTEPPAPGGGGPGGGAVIITTTTTEPTGNQTIITTRPETEEGKRQVELTIASERQAGIILLVGVVVAFGVFLLRSGKPKGFGLKAPSSSKLQKQYRKLFRRRFQ